MLSCAVRIGAVFIWTDQVSAESKLSGGERLQPQSKEVIYMQPWKCFSKFVAMVMSVIIALGMIPATVVHANERTSFNDVPVYHWAHNVIERWAGDGYGVLHGVGGGNFAPDQSLTLAELAAILSNTFGYIEQISAEVTPVWATDQVQRAMAAGVIDRADRVDASQVITREQAIRYIARA